MRVHDARLYVLSQAHRDGFVPGMEWDQYEHPRLVFDLIDERAKTAALEATLHDVLRLSPDDPAYDLAVFQGNKLLGYVMPGCEVLEKQQSKQVAKTAALTAERDALAETCRAMRAALADYLQSQLYEQSLGDGVLCVSRWCSKTLPGIKSGEAHHKDCQVPILMRALALPITEAEARVTAQHAAEASA